MAGKRGIGRGLLHTHMSISKLLCSIALSLSCMNTGSSIGLFAFIRPLCDCVLVFSHFFLAVHRVFQMSFLNRFMIELMSVAAAFLVLCGVVDVVVHASGTRPRMRSACLSRSEWKNEFRIMWGSNSGGAVILSKIMLRLTWVFLQISTCAVVSSCWQYRHLVDGYVCW